MTQDITNVVAQIPAVIEALTGLDILGTLKNLPGVNTTDGQDTNGLPRTDAPAPPDS